MGLLMEKTLSVYGYKIIQNCFGLLQFLESKGFSQKDFLEFVEKSKKENADLSKPAKHKKVKVTKTKYLMVGETEKMSGVKCSKCGGNIFITPTCCTNPLKAQGFLRKGICGTCGIEFGIR